MKDGLIGRRSIVFTTGSVALSQILMAAAGVLTARPLGPDGKGVVAAIVTWTQMLSWASLAGTNSAMTVRVSSAGGRRVGSAVGNAISYSIVAGGVATSVGIVMVPHLLAHLGYGAHRLTLAMLATIPIAVLAELLLAIRLALGDVKLFNGCRLIGPSLSFIVAVAAVSVGRMTPGIYIATLVVASLATTIAAAVGLPWRHVSIDVKALLVDLRFGLKVYLGSLMSFANARLDIVLMATFISASQIGLYSLANNLMAPVTVTAAAFCYLLTPAVATARSTPGGSIEAQVVAIRRASRRAMGIAVAGGLVVVVLAPVAVPFAFGRNFQGAVTMVWILVPGYVARSYAGVVAAGCTGLGRAWLPSRIEGAGLIVTAVALPVGLILAAAVGAAIASTLAYMGEGIAALFVTRHLSARLPLMASNAIPAA